MLFAIIFFSTSFFLYGIFKKCVAYERVKQCLPTDSLIRPHFLPESRRLVSTCLALAYAPSAVIPSYLHSTFRYGANSSRPSKSGYSTQFQKRKHIELDTLVETEVSTSTKLNASRVIANSIAVCVSKLVPLFLLVEVNRLVMAAIILLHRSSKFA